MRKPNRRARSKSSKLAEPTPRQKFISGVGVLLFGTVLCFGFVTLGYKDGVIYRGSSRSASRTKTPWITLEDNPKEFHLLMGAIGGIGVLLLNGALIEICTRKWSKYHG